METDRSHPSNNASGTGSMKEQKWRQEQQTQHLDDESGPGLVLRGGLEKPLRKQQLHTKQTQQALSPRRNLRVRFHIIRNARIENVGKSQSCMVSKLRFIWKQTVVWRRASEGLATVVDDSSPLCATTRDDRATLVFPGMCVFGVGGTWVEEWSPAQIRAEIAESWAGQQEVRLTLGWPRLSSPYGGLTGYHRSTGAFPDNW